jgi:hypothetical protein
MWAEFVAKVLTDRFNQSCWAKASPLPLAVASAVGNARSVTPSQGEVHVTHDCSSLVIVEISLGVGHRLYGGVIINTVR